MTVRQLIIELNRFNGGRPIIIKNGEGKWVSIKELQFKGSDAVQMTLSEEEVLVND